VSSLAAYEPSPIFLSDDSSAVEGALAAATGTARLSAAPALAGLADVAVAAPHAVQLSGMAEAAMQDTDALSARAASMGERVFLPERAISGTPSILPPRHADRLPAPADAGSLNVSDPQYFHLADPADADAGSEEEAAAAAARSSASLPALDIDGRQVRD
jgi:hypothetical protein